MKKPVCIDTSSIQKLYAMKFMMMKFRDSIRLPKKNFEVIIFKTTYLLITDSYEKKLKQCSY